MIKTKNHNCSVNKSNNLGYDLDDCNINNLAKNQVSAVFYSRTIRISLSLKFIALCMEMPSLCPLEGHKHSGRNITKHLSLSFAIGMKILL